ncbi:DUF523 domain-containing protein [Sulfurimonas sp.]|uniref:DUF523 domain-containing protein n=1 Tax=Sulfurimonas sp. TaxID=2022749 RepID=UPI0025E77FB4|nr:DUF523 domain-containing protein [Sulfurimonas sp.]
MQYNKPKVLVSSCLLGCKVRYNASDVNVENKCFEKLAQKYELVAFCPEVSAGLPTPRPSAEIQGGEGLDVLLGLAKVIEIDGVDVSEAFICGAQMALEICIEENISLAILNESSPSCGSSSIYDGSFSGVKKNRHGCNSRFVKAKRNRSAFPT